MSRKSNNFVISNQPTGDYRKCAHHIHSHNYANNMKQHDQIMNKAGSTVTSVDMNAPINIKIVFHFMAPRGSYNKNKVLARVHDVIMTLNDDFNNYSNNPNTMNNYKYKSVVNQVFLSNMNKQNTYLNPEYLKYLPTSAANITFELGQIYYYPIVSRLNLAQYDDVRDVEIEHQVIKQYIHQNRADAINPECFLNIWIVDMVETSILGFSNFPWENLDNYHGIIIHRRVFFPEDYNETLFHMYKTFTHEVGHYLGLLHVYSQNSASDQLNTSNINIDTRRYDTSNINFSHMSDPSNQTMYKRLHSDDQYNPLFMNFMDYTCDKYVSMFTQNQIQKMRYMILNYRPKINTLQTNSRLPVPKYNPETDTMTGSINSNPVSSTAPIIPSHEPVQNPRLTAQGVVSHFPKLPVVESKNNAAILELIPNLSMNNLVSTSAGTQNEIINNIQKNLPDPQIEAAKQADLYDKMVKKSNNYNSDNGYANYYPYDNYTNQQNQNVQAAYNQMAEINRNIQSNMPVPPHIIQNNPYYTNRSVNIPTQTRIDPQLAYYNTLKTVAQPKPLTQPQYVPQTQPLTQTQQNNTCLLYTFRSHETGT